MLANVMCPIRVSIFMSGIVADTSFHSDIHCSVHKPMNTPNEPQLVAIPCPSAAAALTCCCSGCQLSVSRGLFPVSHPRHVVWSSAWFPPG